MSNKIKKDSIEPFNPDEWQECRYFPEKVLYNGKYINPEEEPVRQWMIHQLINKFQVPIDMIDIEIFEKVIDEKKSSLRRPGLRPDIEIYDDRFPGRNVVFVMDELLAPEYNVDSDSWNEHYDRLNHYMSISSSARYAILSNGKVTKFYRRDLEYPRALFEIPIIPTYESAAEAAQKRSFRVVYNPKDPNRPRTGLRPLTRSDFRSVLGDTRSGCHSILRDNEGYNPQEAVEAMVKILYAKYYDEMETLRLAVEEKEDQAYIFSTDVTTDPQRLLTQVKEIFEKGKEWERQLLEKHGRLDTSRRVFKDEVKIELKTHTIFKIVQRLQQYSLHDSDPDVKGSVFEDFLSTTFRDDLGQYFTPTPVVDLLIGILNPTVDDIIGDPCCGPARTLTHSLHHVAKKLNITSAETDNKKFINFRGNNLFGADNSEPILHVARINALLNDAPFIDLRNINSLQRMSSIADKENGGYRKIGFVQEGLTMIGTNPPFGIKITDPDILRHYNVLSNKKTKSAESHILFLERCLEFLVPGGRLGIVFPDGILANTSASYVRNWIPKYGKIIGVVSLPEETFAPFGANVKTSVVFLKKWKHGEKTGSHDVYMSRIDNIGYEASGRSRTGCEVEKIIKDFHENTRWN